MTELSTTQLVQLISAVFPAMPQDRRLAILVDVPNELSTDTPEWQQRRALANDWAQKLAPVADALHLQDIHLVAYPSVDSNNADLPKSGYLVTTVPDLAAQLTSNETPFEEIFQSHQLFLAPTQYSTTAPLKVAAKKHGFRAATMPGFSPRMIPALQIDYGLVNERCQQVKALLDKTDAVEVHFRVEGKEDYHIHFDTRFRPAHASGGRFPEPGTAGNLPSGETYIVPYEGEKGEPSQTSGVLPVQFDDEVVLFKIEANRALKVLSDGPQSREQALWLEREPAYGNMAELGFGVLGDFGLQPIDEILLDEKLAFHVAFGRSDHFGGATGPDKFSSPAAVVHIDRIYSPAMQPRISLVSVTMVHPHNHRTKIIENDRYLIF